MKASIGIVYFYTYMLFDTAGSVIDVLLGAAVYTLFLLMVVALTLLTSTLSKSSVMAALLAFVGFLAITAVSALPRFGNWLPGNLMARSMERTGDGVFHADLWANIGTTIGLTVVFLALSILILRKREGE